MAIHEERALLAETSATSFSAEQPERIASLARALAHPARVRIVAFLLSKPGCIGGEIVDEVGLAQSTVSEHLKILKESGLVKGEIDYPRICYSLDPAALDPIRDLLDAVAARLPEADDTCCYAPKSETPKEKSQVSTLTVYDPAMCCSTGICGTDVDQRLVDLAADLDWLKAQGVTVQRFGLSREPEAFVANEAIRQLMQESEGDDLPAFMVGDVLKAKGRYPDRAELAGWFGIEAVETVAATAPSSCCGGGAGTRAEASGCCGGASKSDGETATTGSCC